MRIYKSNYDLSHPDYLSDTETILQTLVRSEHHIVQAVLHDKPVYIVTDMALAKTIFEDGKNFSFTATPVAEEAALTEGTKAFVNEGLASPLTAATYEDYLHTRNLFNQAFKHSVTDQAERICSRAKAHITALLNDVQGFEFDALALCRNYWMPLAAEVIGLDALNRDELDKLAANTRIVVEANGLLDNPEAISTLATANQISIDLISKVVEKKSSQKDSAIGYLLKEVGAQKTIDLARSFVLGGIDTGSTALALQTHLLASNSIQRAYFMAMSEEDQRNAITELTSKEAPAYYTTRFAVRDVKLADIDIPAGSFLQLPLHGLNSCANPDFDVKRKEKSACPIHNNETLPFGHARHKCPGESLARYLIPIFLGGVFEKYPTLTVKRYQREQSHFSRTVSEFIVQI